jgi:hypothetical protein
LSTIASTGTTNSVSSTSTSSSATATATQHYCFRTNINASTGGDASLNNTYIYSHEPNPNVYRLLLQGGVVPGEYGEFSNDVLQWFPRGSGSGPLNFVLENSGSQTWDIVSLSSTQATEGLILDSQRGLVVVGEFAGLFYGWLGELLFQMP